MPNFRFRSTPTWGMSSDVHIDADNGIIYGVTAMQAGIEALGHGVMADALTLSKLATLGNAKTSGVRGRFGHPGASENATGKQVQMAKAFRVAGNKLLHDSHLLLSARKSPAFSQDPIAFILDMAENSPTEFGESAVISAATVWTLADGREVSVELDAPGEYFYPIGLPQDVALDDKGRPITATTDLPVLRPEQFHYVDFVNEGALTHEGMFSVNLAADMFSGHSSEFAHELFSLVDRWREAYGVPLDDIPLKVNQLTAKYLAARGRTLEGDTNMTRKLTRRLNAQVVETAAATASTEQATETAEEPTAPIDVEAELALGEAMMTEIEGGDGEESEPATVGEVNELAAEFGALIGSHNELLARVELQSQHIAQLTQNLNRSIVAIKELEAKVTQQRAVIEQVDRNMGRLDGQPSNRVQVPRFNPANSALEQLAFEPAAPKPTHMMGAQAPTGLRRVNPAGEPLSPQRPADPAVNVLATMVGYSRAQSRKVGE